MPKRLLPILLTCMLACTEEEPATEQGTEDGPSEPGATISIEYDAASLCGSSERVEFATRRRDCWDPELPCTISPDPPWITGTAVDCADVDGSMRWEVEVLQTGKYESQLRALSGGVQQGVYCFAPTGQTRTHVANLDIDSNTEFMLAEVAESGCSNP